MLATEGVVSMATRALSCPGCGAVYMLHDNGYCQACQWIARKQQWAEIETRADYLAKREKGDR